MFFTLEIYKDICIESLDYCRKNKGLKIYSYVIMSNHIHLIVQTDEIPLSDIIRDPMAIGFKKFTAKRIIETVETLVSESRNEWILNKFEYDAKKHIYKIKYQVWQRDSHAEELLSNKFIEQKKNYIHQSR
jgi:REP element-mobilizing transposase RayT